MPNTLLQQWDRAFKRSAPDAIPASFANGNDKKGQQVLNSFRDTNVAMFAGLPVTSDNPMPSSRQFTHLGGIYEAFRLGDTGSNVGSAAITDNSLSNTSSQADLITLSNFARVGDKFDQIQKNNTLYNSGEVVEGAVMENMVRNNFRFGDAENNSRRWKHATNMSGTNTVGGRYGMRITATDSLDTFNSVGER